MRLRKLPILMYHSVDTSGSVVSVAPQRFAEQMAAAAEMGYRGISLREAIAHHTANGCWPDKAVVITFDDGYANLYSSAFPSLIQHDFRATFFLVSGHIGRHNDWEPPLPRLGVQPLLSWNQVKEMASAGIEMGAHTKTHRDLRKLPEDGVRTEMVMSRTEIEQQLGTQVESFAYPFGALSPTALAIASREFRASCTTTLGIASQEPVHRLPRVDMYYLPTANDLRLLLEGRLDKYLTVRRFGRAVKNALASPF